MKIPCSKLHGIFNITFPWHENCFLKLQYCLTLAIKVDDEIAEMIKRARVLERIGEEYTDEIKV